MVTDASVNGVYPGSVSTDEQTSCLVQLLPFHFWHFRISPNTISMKYCSMSAMHTG